MRRLAAFLLFVFAGSPPAATQLAITPEIRLHPPSDLFELGPTVAIDQRGEAVVAWDASGSRILSRSFSSTGVPTSEAIVVSSEAYGARYNASISMNRKGEGLLAWNSSAESGLSAAGPFAVCIRSSSEPTCPIFQLATGDRLLNGNGPRMTTSLAGESAIMWFSPGQNFENNRLIGTRFDTNGAVITPNFILDSPYVFNSPTAGHWRLASLPDERFVAVWSEDAASGVGYELVARIFSRTGAPVSELIQVPTAAAGYHVDPDVASDANGNFVVVWESWGREPDGSGIYGQKFNASGAKLGAEFQISSDADSAQFLPAIAMDSSGNFVVTFTSFNENTISYLDIFARAYRGDGSAIGPQVWVTEGTPITEEQDMSAVALSDSGVFVVAYESYRCEPDLECSKDVMARWYSLPCESDSTTDCLQQDRFRTRAFWRTSDGREGLAQRIPLTADTGGFWFFTPENFELLVKLIDGCGTNENYWLFAAGLTDVEVDLLVQDAWTGTTRVFSNDVGTAFQPVQSIESFPTCGVPPSGAGVAPQSLKRKVLDSSREGSAGTCLPAADRLCLLNGRFSVAVSWEDFTGHTGQATSVPLSDESGIFYFFGPSNLEVAIKMVDACSFNDAFWVFSAGLTNLRVHVSVVDWVVNEEWTFDNSLGIAFPPVLDSAAFQTCSGNAL